MRIAYASDNVQQREQFRTHLTAYFDRQPTKSEVCIFDSPEKLLDSALDTMYDLVFFNMTYGERSGIAYVYKMRAFDPNVTVIVLRFTSEGRVECILTTPTLVVLDDFSQKSCFSMLDIAISQLNTNPERSILLRTTQDIGRIVPLTSIVFAEASGHKVTLHLTSGEQIEIHEPIKNLAERLSVHSEFLFPHRSFIVNAFFVSCITTDKIYLRANESTVPIARGKANGIKAAYDEYFRSYNWDTNRSHE